jgi:transposase InsO family protein
MIKKRPKPNGITKADAEAQKSENIIKQDFTAEKPNEKWLSDITEIPCADGKLYLAAILDCYDGKIVGFRADDNMRAELCRDAFELACRKEHARGMILHSDRGSQFTSGMFRSALARHGAIQSMSGTGRCYDNARMESWFATLKKAKIYKIDTKKMRMEEVKSVIFRYICYYNLRRIYSVNDGYPPEVYRQIYCGTYEGRFAFVAKQTTEAA